MNRVGTLLVAALVLLAGCSAVVEGPTDESRANAPAVTPAPVPTDGPTDRFGPGLLARGVTRPEALATAHERRLAGVSFTERTRTVVTFRENATEMGGQSLLVRHDGTAYRIRYDLTGAPRTHVRDFQTVTARIWSDGNHTVQSFTNGANATEYVMLDSPFYGNVARPDALLYARMLADSDARVVDRETRDGTTRYGFEAEIDDPPAAFGLPGTMAVGPASVRATVTDGGLVERVVVTYPTVYRGANATVTHTFEYTDVGTTSVSRPAWYDEAVADGDGDD